jgi:hypothetical protein
MTTRDPGYFYLDDLQKLAAQDYLYIPVVLFEAPEYRALKDDAKMALSALLDMGGGPASGPRDNTEMTVTATVADFQRYNRRLTAPGVKRVLESLRDVGLIAFEKAWSLTAEGRIETYEITVHQEKFELPPGTPSKGRSAARPRLNGPIFA